jgi:hypothetical protein
MAKRKTDNGMAKRKTDNNKLVISTKSSNISGASPHLLPQQKYKSNNMYSYINRAENMCYILKCP